MNEPFVLEGKLMLAPQEGGFADDAFEVDGKSLDDLVAEHFGVQRVKIGDLPPYWSTFDGLYPGVRPIGFTRITIERLSPGDIREERK